MQQKDDEKRKLDKLMSCLTRLRLFEDSRLNSSTDKDSQKRFV